jgi:hypothetical protein
MVDGGMFASALRVAEIALAQTSKAIEGRSAVG